LKFKRRSGVGERQPYIMMFMLIFNASISATNALGLFSYAVQPNSSYGVGQIQTQISCQTYTLSSTSSQCTPSIGNTATIIPNILIFGDWWGVLLMLYNFATGLVIPGWFLVQFFGVNVAIVAFIGILTVANYASWFFMIIWVRSGRPL
jgi:hypothetical protein